MTKDEEEVKKHPFIVKKSFWGYKDRFHLRKYYRYKVVNEQTKEVWRSFDSRKDAYEFAYYANGNIGEYSTKKWY